MISSAFLQEKPDFKIFIIIFFVSFLLRAGSFYFYVQHEERYCQADSVDYHVNTLGLALGKGMHRIDTNEPLFWRTPGYPAYLAFFYHLFGVKNLSFQANSTAQKASIWVQIILCSFLPILIFFLAFLLTQSYLISWISTIISIMHVGFILASNYLLTDGLAMIFFVLFLIYIYRAFEQLKAEHPVSTNIINLFAAALFLGIYTWMRPMGQFLALISVLILLATQIDLKKRAVSASIFALLFLSSISPWYVRNYQLTGSFFFCPLFGPYLTVFSAPKIKAKAESISLEKAHKILCYEGGKATQEALDAAKASGSTKKVCSELACLKAAMPWITNYPFYFLQDWIQEVIKTSFDLYSSQLVAFAANNYKWDPLVEYLDQKILACLFKQPMGLFMRLICWLEFIWTVLMWFGLFAGTVQFIIKPLFNREELTDEKKKLLILWLITGIIIGSAIGITGGFGYARLRLPIEPLMIILTLTYYNWAYAQYREKQKLAQSQVDSSTLSAA